MSDDNKMPDAVKLAIKELLSAASFYRLEAQRDDRPIAAADALESWWRNLAQPVALGMTRELLLLLEKVDDAVTYRLQHGSLEEAHILTELAAAVRQQATQGRKVELGKARELIFMVRNLTPYLAQLGYADLSRSFNDYADEALAELDAFEKEG